MKSSNRTSHLVTAEIWKKNHQDQFHIAPMNFIHADLWEERCNLAPALTSGPVHMGSSLYFCGLGEGEMTTERQNKMREMKKQQQKNNNQKKEGKWPQLSMW